MEEILKLTGIYDNLQNLDDFNIIDTINIYYNKLTHSYKLTRIREDYDKDYKIELKEANINSYFFNIYYNKLIYLIDAEIYEEAQTYAEIIFNYINSDIFNDELNFDIIKYNLIPLKVD